MIVRGVFESFQAGDVGICTVFVSNPIGDTTSAGAGLDIPVEDNVIGMLDGPEARAHTGPRQRQCLLAGRLERCRIPVVVGG